MLSWIPATEPPNGAGLRGTLSREKEFARQALPAELVTQQLLQQVKSPTDISFLFSIIDSGSGRELQDEPTHNLASLGKSNGERPFRLLAQPLSFLPRSTIRLQIIESSEGVRGTLFIVLYGYKMLGAAGCPEPIVRSLRGSPICPTEAIGNPSARVIPFDYVATLPLTGRPGNRVEEEISINVEGGFVATALGYGLAVEKEDVGPGGSSSGTRNPRWDRQFIEHSATAFTPECVERWDSHPTEFLEDRTREQRELSDSSAGKFGRQDLRTPQSTRGCVISLCDLR
jgi:hypothetical protein